MMIRRSFLHVAFTCTAWLVASQAALAHHPMGGKTPETFVEGFLSGIGHPIIGIDHLAFIVALGLVAGIGGFSLWMPLTFIITSALGVALHVQGIGIPGVELAVAASVVVVGGLIAVRATLPTTAWLALFAIAGLFHGHAYGEAVYGAEASPLWAYLAGLAIVQGAIMSGVALLASGRNDLSPVAPRLIGATIAGVGIAVLAGQILPA